MAYRFPSDEWVKALCKTLNESEAYAEAAKNWEGDFYFIIEPDAEFKETVYLYMDLWHGKCREAFLATDPSVKDPVFKIWAPYGTWKKVILGQLDPIQGLVTRQLKLKGDMIKIMRNVKAANELVKCCAKVETEFAA